MPVAGVLPHFAAGVLREDTASAPPPNVLDIRPSAPEHAPVRIRNVWLVLVGLSAGCLSPNPKSCKDGLCTDQRYPFCDADGSFEGAPETCIAVDCEPSSFVRCLGDQAVKCNATGNDYDLTTCEQGCNDTTGCRACSTNDQCSAAAPVCGSDGTCRTCVKDDECASLVCEQGSCVPESGILYASPGGDDSAANCSRSTPCSPNRAFTLARAAAVPPIVRYLPGVYAMPLDFAQATAVPLVLVGTGATLAATNAIVLRNAASLRLRGLAIAASSSGITCGDSSGPRSKLFIEDATLEAADTATGLLAVNYCDANVQRSTFKLNASGGAAIAVTSFGSFVGDRLRVSGLNGSVGGFGDHLDFTLSNSLIDRTTVSFSTFDQTGPGSSFRFGSNTIIGNPVACEQRNFRLNVYDNNIVYAPNLPTVASGTNCRLNNNVLYPQQTPIANNISAAPMFVNAGGSDYHLLPGSPAVDAARATGDFPMATPDLDGTSRPQGGAPDVGAFERKP